MARPKIPLADRFWKKVNKNGPTVRPELGPCWLWMGATASHGYGTIAFDGGDPLVHRVSFEMAYGPIPEGLEVCHQCDIHACVRPDHFFLGTHRANMLDMIAKGRDIHFHGSLNRSSRLNETIVREMRRLRSLPKPQRPTYVELGRMFSVEPMTAFYAVKGHTWKHVS